MPRRATGKAFILGAALAVIFRFAVGAAHRPALGLRRVPSTPAAAPVLNLTAEDFQVTENGVKREVVRATLGNTPMRIVLMVDSSTPVGPMINNFRTALNAFADALPEIEEIVFISSGGQIRVRTQPGSDRDKLRAEIARFASEGGANAFSTPCSRPTSDS